jgi:eukaryotic-like serine/threonine-protein kinase
VERHPRRPGEVVLRNLSETKWTVAPAGEDVKTVKPQQRLWVRPMTIDFGTARGSIQVPGGPGGSGG